MIFIDAAYFIATARVKDQWHGKAWEIQDQIKNKDKITSVFVLSEVITHIGNRSGGKKGVLFYEYVKKSMEIVNPNNNIIQNAMDKFLMYDGTLSFADVVSLEIMETQGIDTIVSFDSDFDKVQGIKRIH